VKKILKIIGIIFVALFIIMMIVPSSESNKEVSNTDNSSDITEYEETKEAEELPVDVSQVEENMESKEEHSEETLEAEEVEKTKEISEENCQILPDITYMSEQEELCLYANLEWNEDNTIDIQGFGYMYDIFMDELYIEERLIQDSEYENCYNSEDGNVFLAIEDGYITIMSNSDTDISFTGDFSLISSEPIETIPDVIELSEGEMVDFFRDANNIGKTFKCKMEYSSCIKAGEYTVHYLYIHENDKMLQVLVKGNLNSIFFVKDTVSVTGVYSNTGENGSDITVDIIDIKLVK